MRIEFVNLRNHPVEIFWDSRTPRSGLDNYLAFTQEIQANPKKFWTNGVVKPGRALELNSFEHHVFVAVDEQTKQVVWVGAVQKDSENEFKIE